MCLDEHGHFDGVVEEDVLAEQAVFEHLVAVIGGDEDGGVGDVFELHEDEADFVIEHRHAGVVAAPQALQEFAVGVVGGFEAENHALDGRRELADVVWGGRC